jgi:hypothetical protein
MGREFGFWLAVALVAIVGLALFKLLAASPVGERIPGAQELAGFL